MELVVACTVMMTALTSMAYVTTSAFGDIAMAKERHAANGLLDEAIEQLRALPYDTVSLGMRTSDLAGDPRVIGAGTAASPYRLATSNERIVHVSTNQIIAPLVPNVSSRTIDHKVYAVRVYLTHFYDDPLSGAVTATAYVDWTSAVRNTGTVSMRAITVIFSPAAASAGSSGACQSTATHPFSGPCLPFVHGMSAADPGQILMSGTGALALVNQVSSSLPSASSLMQVEQTSSVQGRAVRAGSTNGTIRSGYEPANSKADNDPASKGSTPYDAAYTSSATTSITGSSGATVLTLDGSGDTAESVSTTAATSTQVCTDLAGTTALTDGEPCGRTSGHLSSMAASVNLGTLNLTSHLLGTIVPYSISGARVTSHTDRQVTSTTGACTGAVTPGCVRAISTRSIDSLRLGVMPSGRALVKLEGFTSTVTAEGGIAAAEPTATAAGTVSVWSPLLVSYQTVAVTFGSGTTITVPPVTVTDLAFSGVTLVVSAELRTGSEAKSSDLKTCMAGLACRTRADATLGSPLIGTVTYAFTHGSNVTSLTVTVDLGNISASASYADPPSTA